MDDQLKQSALDFHEFPVPGKSRFPTNPLATQRDWRWPTHRALPHLLFKSKKPVKSRKYTARGNLVAVISNGTPVLGLGTLARWLANR
ncbi:hypothetical protein ACLK19_16225 [Escherichia coli]